MAYQYRNHPISEAYKEDSKILCIMGLHTNGSETGVLEWCRSHGEAKEMFVEMMKDDSLTDLSIEYFRTNKNGVIDKNPCSPPA